MKVLVNCSVLNSTGPLQVALSFINECRMIKHEYHVICGPAFEKIIDPRNYPSNFYFYYTKKRMISGLINFIKVRRLIINIEEEVNPNVVFSVFGPGYWRPTRRHVLGFATPHVLYPESPFFTLIPLKRKIWWYIHRKVNLILLKYESKEIILETQEMEKRLKAKLPFCTTYVVPNSYSDVYKNFQNEKERKVAEDGFFKILTLCSYKRHKNLEIIPFVVDVLKAMGYNSIRFYLTLSDAKYVELVQERYRNYIINLGPLHPNQCPAAYSSVDAMFLPTLLESFSASYPEAMKMMKPILTSNYDFATSVCGNAAIYFDPLNPQSCAKAIVQLIEDPELYKCLVKKGIDRMVEIGDANSRAQAYLRIMEKNA